jgi:hypothetical protein
MIVEYGKAFTERSGYGWNRGDVQNAEEMKRETSAIKEWEQRRPETGEGV